MRKYIAFFGISIRSVLAYAGEFAATFVFLWVLLFVFFQLWQTVYDSPIRHFEEYTLEKLIFYLIVTEALVLSAPRVAYDVGNEIRTGAIATKFVQPYNYLAMQLAISSGERLVRFLLTLTAGLAFGLIFLGSWPTDLHGLLFFSIALVPAFTLDFLIAFLVGIGAFWLDDIGPLAFVISRIAMIVGGVLIPIDFFPNWLQPVFYALPFAGITYGPARLFVEPEQRFLLELLLVQSLWIIVIALCSAIVFSLGSKRVRVNGG